MDYSFPNDGNQPIRAELELGAGEIVVKESAGPLVQVSLEPAGRDSRRAMEAIEQSVVSFENGRLVVRVPSRIRSVELLMRVAMPANSSVRAATASADADFSLLLGSLDVRTASGDVRAEDVDGDAAAVTASGDVEVQSVAGRLGARTASGDLRASSVGGEVSVETASGDVLIGAVAQSAKIRTASGDVDLAWARSGEINVSTVSGDVVVGVAQGSGAWLDLSTVSGDTSCSLMSEPNDESAADLRLLCKTVSGDIAVRQAAAA